MRFDEAKKIAATPLCAAANPHAKSFVPNRYNPTPIFRYRLKRLKTLCFESARKKFRQSLTIDSWIDRFFFALVGRKRIGTKFNEGFHIDRISRFLSAQILGKAQVRIALDILARGQEVSFHLPLAPSLAKTRRDTESPSQFLPTCPMLAQARCVPRNLQIDSTTRRCDGRS